MKVYTTMELVHALIFVFLIQFSLSAKLRKYNTLKQFFINSILKIVRSFQFPLPFKFLLLF